MEGRVAKYLFIYLFARKGAHYYAYSIFEEDDIQNTAVVKNEQNKKNQKEHKTEKQSSSSRRMPQGVVRAGGSKYKARLLFSSLSE